MGLESKLHEDYERFIFWLTGYEANHLPKAWANVLVNAVTRASLTLDNLEWIIDFFHYQQSD